MKFEFKESQHNARMYKLIGELPDRVQAIMRAMPYEVARAFFVLLQRMAPRGAIQDYPDTLELKQFDLPDLVSVAGVVDSVSKHMTYLQSIDVPRTVLYVQPRSLRGEPDPAALILSENNPWTMDTLPYEPDKRAAAITSRKVTASEVEEVRRRRAADGPMVDRKLRRVGVIPSRKHPTLLEKKVERDVAFEVLRVEFGMHEMPRAHWRPALQMTRGPVLKQEFSRMLRWLSTPGEARWTQKLKLPKGKRTEAKRVRGFQDHIAG